MKSSRDKEHARIYKQKQFTLDNSTITELNDLKTTLSELQQRNVSGSEIVRLAVRDYKKKIDEIIREGTL